MARTQRSEEPRRLATAPRHVRRGPAPASSRPESVSRTRRGTVAGAASEPGAASDIAAAQPIPPDEAPDTSPGALGSGSSPEVSADSAESPNAEEKAAPAPAAETKPTDQEAAPEKASSAKASSSEQTSAAATTADRPEVPVDADPASADGAQGPVISLRDVGVEFSRTRKDIGLRDLLFRRDTGPSRDAFWPLRNVTFDIAQGDAVGVIGRNGQGKSTLLKLVAGVLLPDEGEVAVRQGVAPLIEITGGFSPDLTGKENVYLAAGLHGMPKELIDEKYDEIVDFAEMKDFMDTPFRHYSSGMKVRLAFSVISQLEEPILLVDEVLAVGDKVFKKKCYDRIDSMLAEGRTMFLVSHSNSDLKRFCTRGLYLREGALRADGPIKDVLKQYDEQG